MERSIEVATGESVAFSYELAGLGSRFLAVFIDMLIQGTVAAVVLIVFGVLGLSMPAATGRGPGQVVFALVLAMAIFATFLLFFGYFIAFEWLWDGRTPGKRIVGIRVVRDGGFPVDFTSSLIRNVVRILEFGLGFYAISVVSTLISPQNRRLGDFAAGTIVVRDRFVTTSSPAAPAAEPSLQEDPLVRELSAKEREIVRRYAERRAALSDRSREMLAAQIAGIVRPNLPARFDHLDDDELLEHVAAALR